MQLGAGAAVTRRPGRAGPGRDRGGGGGPGPGDGDVPQPGGLGSAAAAAGRARGRRQRPGGAVQLPHLPGSLPSARGHRQLRTHVLRGVPPAVSAGAIPPVPTVPPALRPQESGQGRPRGEAAFVLQGTLPGLQQEGDTGQDESARCLLREGPGADGQLSQVRPCGAHVPAHPQCRPQQVHLRLPLLWCPQPGSAGVGEALRGQPPQRPQPRGVSHLLSHALGRPELQERQLPAAPAPPAQVLLRHLRGLQHRRGGRLPGRPGPVSLRELKAWPLAQASRLKGHAPPAPAAQACLGRRLEGQVEPHCCKRRGHVPVALSRWPRGAGHWDGVCPLCLKAMMSSLQRGPFRPCRVHRPPH